jgi:hypothetical protein
VSKNSPPRGPWTTGRFPFYLRLALVALLLLVVGRACVFRPATDHPGSHFNRATNAAWLSVDWVNAPHSPEEIEALAATLQAREIRYAFVYTSYLKPEGHFNPTYDHAPAFVQSIHATYPELNVQAWIGLPLHVVDLGDTAVRYQIAAFCAERVREAGFDGVHLDPEPVSSGDRDVLALLDEVREEIGPQADLSIAARRIVPIFPNVHWPLVGRFAWHTGYYREVAGRVDQVAAMTYDSGLPSAALYRHHMRFQTIDLSRAIEGTGAELFIGIPTSEERTRTHRPRAENVESGLRGVVDGLNDAQARPAQVTGVAIYPYWETDEAEWAIYEELWK